MTSPPLDSTHGWQRQVWHVITALGQQTRSAMSGVALHHSLWTVHTVGNVGHGRREWHYITDLGQHTRSNYFGRGMTSPPLDSTHGRMTSGVTCHHCLWAAHTVELRRAWHDITAIGKHIRSDYVKRDMTSLPLDSTHGRTTSGVEFHHAFGQHTRSNDVGRGKTSPPLDNTHGRTTSGVA